MDPLVEYASRTELVAVGSHVVIRIVDGHRTQLSDFERLEAVIRVRLADVPLFGVLQVSWHGSPTPPPAVLRQGAKLMESYADRSCVAVALLGLGHWSAVLTNTITGFAGLLRRSRIEVTTSVEAATEALARELVGLNAEALALAYEELYAYMRSL